MGARITKLDRGPLTTLTDNDILNLTKSVWERLAPTVVVCLVSFLPRLLLATCDILESTIICYNFCASIRVPHVPGLVELADNLFGRMHNQDNFQSGAGDGPFWVID